MAVVGNNLGQNFLAAAKPSATSVRSSAKPGARPSSASSSSSSDFAKIFNQKESGFNKNSQTKNEREKIDTYVPPREQKEITVSDKQPPKRIDENADLPGSGQDMPNNLSGRLEGRELNQKMPVREVSHQDSNNIQMKAERRESDESVDNLAHRQALQQLLKRMKDEFNLDAEEIVGAFAQLSTEELQQPPEETLDLVIQGLPLSPEQQVAAKAIFQDMLKQTAADGMADYLTASRRQLSLEVVSKNQAQSRATSRAVDQMQSNFFVAPQAKLAVNPQAGLSKYKNQKNSSEQSDSSLMGMMATAAVAGTALGATQAQNAAANNPVAGQVAMNTPSTLSDVGSEMPQAESQDWQQLGLEKVNADQATAPVVLAAPKHAPVVTQELYQPSAAAPQAPVAMNEKEQSAWLNNLLQDQSGQASPQAVPSAAAVATPVAAPMSASTAPVAANMSLSALGLAGSGAEAMSSDGDEEANQDGSADLQKLGVQNLNKNSNENNVKGPESFVIQTKPNENQEANNIRQVVNQAQVLARKGGGEMKMILSPEGLGQLTMKVNVQNGHVNVEMMADSSEAKKIIEKGLGELKATLLTHNLKVDLIKVETPADISKQMNMQHDDSQRNSAQQFMEQFRQNNSEWRRGFFDIGSAKMYNSQKEEAERGTMPQPDNKRRSASSRRLDLVA